LAATEAAMKRRSFEPCHVYAAGSSRRQFTLNKQRGAPAFNRGTPRLAGPTGP